MFAGEFYLKEAEVSSKHSHSLRFHVKVPKSRSVTQSGKAAFLLYLDQSEFSIQSGSENIYLNENLNPFYIFLSVQTT